MSHEEALERAVSRLRGIREELRKSFGVVPGAEPALVYVAEAMLDLRRAQDALRRAKDGGHPPEAA